MVLAPNDLFSWNNKYNKYNEYSITDTFTCIFLAMHTTYSVHAGILKPWRGRLPWPLVFFSSYHVFSLPLSGLNWRSLFPPWGSGPPFPKMAPPFTGSAQTPLPGSGTSTMVKSLLQDVKKEEKLNTMNPLWNAHHQQYVARQSHPWSVLMQLPYGLKQY